MMCQSPTSLQTFITCPRQYEAKYITHEVEFKQNPHATFGDLIHRRIEAFLKEQYPLPPILLALQGVLERMGGCLGGVEMKTAINHQGEAVDFGAEDAYIRCIVDVLLVSPDGKKIICIDWKTGKKRNAQTQHDMIKRCVSAMFPKAEEIHTLFIYLFAGKVDKQVYQRGAPLYDLDADMAMILEAHAKNKFTPTPNGLCNKWCDVTSCSFNGRRET